MQKIELRPSQIKVLDTIYQLNLKRIYPNNLGVYKIITGIIDYETQEYTDLDIYASLSSISLKASSFIISRLIKLGLLDKFVYYEDDKEYLRITELGKETLLNYLSHHKVSYKRGKRKITYNYIKLW